MLGRSTPGQSEVESNNLTDDEARMDVSAGERPAEAKLAYDPLDRRRISGPADGKLHWLIE